MVNHIYTLICKPTSPSLLYLHQQLHHRSTITNTKRGPSSSSNNGVLVLTIKAYMEEPNSISSFANKVIGSLPVIGLLARIVNDEGGVGSDIIDFAEFRRRVGKKCSVNDSRAFYEFQDRHGKVISLHFLPVLIFCFVWSREDVRRLYRFGLRFGFFCILSRQEILCMCCYAAG